MRNPYRHEGLYIAGPECFYSEGYTLWWAQRKLAEYRGIPVVLPTSTALKLDHEDKRKNAKEIFDDLIVQVSRTTAIIADLDTFRGNEPDGGTIFELGWMYAKGSRLYGYSRDCRPIAVKQVGTSWKQGILRDSRGAVIPYPGLPFCPSVMASTKLVEGDFKSALDLFRIDLDETRKGIRKEVTDILFIRHEAMPRLYVASQDRNQDDARQKYQAMRQAAETKGYELVTPNDEVYGLPKPDTDDELMLASWDFRRRMALLKSSDIIIADLSNHAGGWEPDNDISFECGAAYGWGKQCYAYTSDARNMRDRIPNADGLDWSGFIVEDFDLPINLMFGVSFRIVQGDFFSAFASLK